MRFCLVFSLFSEIVNTEVNFSFKIKVKALYFQERKKIIKGIKEHVGKIAQDQYGSLVSAPAS